ncbi:Mut7-C RNAse domain protein [uncultured archaeon]|nr:Mut7-C RNAse domain protein [uncultured archaeon]
MERFLVDQMLLRLGRWLRLLGMDVANPENASDSELLRKSIKEKRVLVTRDKRLVDACRSLQGECILIRASRLEEQLREMAQRGVPLALNPQRCTLCNSALQKVDSAKKATWRCEGCKKIYWEGSHWINMEKMLEKIRSSKN